MGAGFGANGLEVIRALSSGAAVALTFRPS
jgi:hypothetical protein